MMHGLLLRYCKEATDTGKAVPSPGGGGTPIHYLYGYAPPNGVVILKFVILERGIHFRGCFLERGIIFRTHKSSSFVSSHLKLFKINSVQCVNKQSVVLLLHPVF